MRAVRAHNDQYASLQFVSPSAEVAMTDPERAVLLFEQAPDAVVFADREGIIREWNESATAIFGHARDEAVGQTLDLIVPERFREAHWRGYDRALADGDTKYRGQAMP